MYMALYETVKSTLDHVDNSLSMTNSFNGTVKLTNGMYTDNEYILDWAMRLNNSASDAYESSEMKLTEITANKQRVVAAESQADVAKMTTEEAVHRAAHADSNTAATRTFETEFREIYHNNTEKLMSLISQRDAIEEDLTMYEEESANATKLAMDANDTAADALLLAKQKRAEATNDNKTASETRAKATDSFDTICQLYENVDAAKNTSIAADEKATRVLAAINSSTTLLDMKETVLVNAEETANKTLALQLESVDRITQLSRDINETIVPEVTVNDTVLDANEALRRAQAVQHSASLALYVFVVTLKLVAVQMYVAVS